MAVDVTPRFIDGTELPTRRFDSPEDAQRYIDWCEASMEEAFGPDWARNLEPVYLFEDVL